MLRGKGEFSPFVKSLGWSWSLQPRQGQTNDRAIPAVRSGYCCVVAFSQGFSCRGAQLEGVWSQIPEGVDILLTHMPPFNRLDLAFDRGTHAKVDPCPVCGETHRRYGRMIGGV